MNPLLSPTRSISDIELNLLTCRYGNVQQQYLEFLRSFYGAIPDENVLKDSDDTIWVRSFLTVNEIIEYKESIAHLSKDMIPIADDDCGNCICIDNLSGKIYHVDHETEDVTFISDSFNEFIDCLIPDTANMEKPSPPIRVWVNPAFKPETD